MNYRNSARISGGERDLTEYVEAVRYVHQRDAGLLAPNHRPHPAASDVCGMTSGAGIARTWCDSVGISTRGLSEGELLTTALRASKDIAQRGGGTSSYAGILANLAQGSTLLGWNRIRHTWRDLCRVALVNDFRRSNRAGLDEIGLAPVPEHGEIKTSPTGDRVEYAEPVSNAGILNISRAALLADARQALVLDPMRAGVAASGFVNQSLFDLLAVANGVGPTLNTTGRAVFNTTDKTLAASGAALTVATLAAGRKAMRAQADASSLRKLNIAPAILLAAPGIEDTARVLAAASWIANDPGNLKPLADSALDAISATAWYLFADPNMHDTFEVCFLGSAEPELVERATWETDGLSYKVRIDFDIVPLDFRGVYRNAGA